MTFLTRLHAGVRLRAAVVAALSSVLVVALAGQASAAVSTVNVNPATGKDTNSGSAAQPLKTLAKALSLAHSGDTISLAGGFYSASANGERFSSATGTPAVTVPSGVTIHGFAGNGFPTVLEGDANHIGLVLAGSAALSDVQTENFSVGIEASQGTQTLSGLDFTGDGLELSGTANAQVLAATDPAHPLERGVFFSPGRFAVALSGHARVLLDGDKVLHLGSDGKPHPNCDITQRGIFAVDNSQVTIKDGADFENITGGVVDARGSAKVAVDSTTIRTQYLNDQCAASPTLMTTAAATLTLTRSVLASNNVGSVNFADGVGEFGSGAVTVRGSQITGYNGHGIHLNALAPSLTVQNTKLTDNTVGLDAQQALGAAVTLSGSQVDANVNGIVTHNLTMTTTEVARNIQTGVTVSGQYVDLGTPAVPGLNQITDNGVTGVTFAGPGAVPGVIDAVGEEWNPGVQGANGFGFYNDLLTVTGNDALGRGSNFVLPDRSQSINLGPV